MFPGDRTLHIDFSTARAFQLLYFSRPSHLCDFVIAFSLLLSEIIARFALNAPSTKMICCNLYVWICLVDIGRAFVWSIKTLAFCTASLVVTACAPLTE